MHEVGILCAILKKVDKIVEEENLTHVEKIVLQVGQLSGVVPHYMDECWPAAIYKTKYQDTKLELEVIPGIVRCEECGMEFNGFMYNLICPSCNRETKTTPLSGRELIIKEIVGC